MNKWIAVAAGAIIAYVVITSWPGIVRYRRMLAM